MRTSALAVVILVALAACSGKQGGPGTDGRSVALRTAIEASGANCANGGIKVETGADDNVNQSLDDAEVDSTVYVCGGVDGQSVVPTLEGPGSNCPEGGVRLTPDGGPPIFVCNGTPGASGLAGESVAMTPEPAGASCQFGGQRLQVGSGTPTYVCNGAPGETGPAGESVAMTPEPAGASCQFGGQRLQVGSGLPAYVCNGAPGATGPAGESVAMTPEPAGANCAYGGQRLQVGSGTPTYVCNGAPGATGPAGESVAMTPEPAGASCEFGGQRLQVGSGSPSYVCNGAPGATGPAGQSVAMTPEPAGVNCQFGGQRLQVGSGLPAYACNGAPGETGPAGESIAMTPEPAGVNCQFGGVILRVGTGPEAYICSGAPSGVTLPAVLTVDVTGVRYVEAVVNATVTSDGGEFILVRGVILAAHPSPTIHDSVYFSGTGAGAFATRCDGLAPGTTYFVRAFATNALGTSYGDELSFTTGALTVPTLTTQAVSSITNTTAIAGGDITDDGGTPILGRGICWALAPDPTTADACASEGVGSGSFIALATGLTSAATYHMRAYATNAQGTSYGDDLSFTTVVLPLATVTTSAASGVSYGSAIGGGTVVGDNGAPVTSRGICWATTPAPTTADTCSAEAGGLGAFTLGMTGLAANTTFHVRAYAVNGGGTSYGADLTFTTLAPAVPSLSTKAIGGISSDIAGSGGAIASDGGSAITAKGVCWSLNPSPTIANAKTTDGTGPASFSSTLTGLNPLTTYYVRAWATNALGTAYGNQLSFTTSDLVTPGPTVPVVGTSPSAITGSTTASSGGYVSRDGGSPVTARGVCWSTSPSPTLANSCSNDGGTGVGYFSSTVTGLGGCGVVYYVRAYATNATGTAYGNQNTVSTGLMPTVSTAPVTAIGYYTATSGGAITDNGGCAITQKGVAWNWTPNPTTGNPMTTEGAGDAAFVSSVAGLFANRTYYLRAYATNSVGTAYGPQLVFTTLEPATLYVGQYYAGGMIFYLDGTGQHGLVSALVDSAYGPWGCQGTSIPTGTAVGTGATNTAAIVASCAESGIAAKVADNSVLSGYDDWFLPSRDELGLMWTNLGSQGLGGFGGGWYSSSSESGTSSNWAVYLQGGNVTNFPKSSGWAVRAVRAF